ncbi:MAG: esterase [Acidobacteria bacterium]|nr:MAG: esterase [Acidobacteriota bacterium]
MPPEPRGAVVVEEFESGVLAGNPAGDPARRSIPVYLPPGYGESERRYPVIFCLSGFTGRGLAFLNDQPFQPNLARRMDRLIARGEAEPAVLVMPDGFTRYGGSQYINSPATGRYEDHIVEELVPWVDRRLRTLPDASHRGLMGKSSGGYGALVLAMRHPELFGAAACHSGDMYFEYCYLPDFPRCASIVEEKGGLEGFLRFFDAAPKKSREMLVALNIIAMSACYSPNPARPPFFFELPFRERTGELRPDVFDRWLAHDPVRMIPKHEGALRGLKLLLLDCGTKDEWNLHLGARIFTSRLRERGIGFRYDEFDDGHLDITYRYDISLPLLTKALS